MLQIKEEDNTMKGKIKVLIRALCLVTVLVSGTLISVNATEYPASWRGKTLTIMMQAGDVSGPMMVQEEFEAMTGAKLEIVGIPMANLYEKIVTELVSQTGAYNLIEYYYQWKGVLFGEGYFAPLEQFFRDETFVYDHFPLLLDAYGTWEGTIYGLPYDGDVQILYYRKDLFSDPKNKAEFAKQFGYELVPPETWDQYLDAAKFFTRGSEAGNPNINYGGVKYGTALMAMRGDYLIGLFLSRFAANGGAWFDDSGRPAIDSEAGMRALDSLKAAVPYSPPGTLSFSYMEVKEAFNKGEAAMCEQWTGIGDIDPKQSVVVGKSDYKILPKGGSGLSAPCLAGGAGIGIPVDARDKDLGFAFLEFLGLPKNQKKISLAATGVDPTRASVYNDPGFRAGFPYWKAGLDSFQKGAMFITSKLGTDMNEILALKISQCLAGKKTSQQALGEAAKEWRTLLGQ